MKCHYCQNEGNLTVRDGSDVLHNCCMSCYKKSREEIVDKAGNIQPNPHRLWISCVWKEGGETSEFVERHNHRSVCLDTDNASIVKHSDMDGRRTGAVVAKALGRSIESILR